MSMDDVFQNIVAPERTGPHRLQVLENPVVAQMQAIPVGADVIVATEDKFMAGPWTEATRDGFCGVADANDCGHLHGFLVYLPPVPTPDSALSAESIAADIHLRFKGARDAAVRDRDTDRATRVLIAMLEEAVHKAREGMVFPPF